MTTPKQNSPVVLITGALTGIGRATAFALAKEGSPLVVSGRHDDVGQKLVEELKAIGTEALFVRCDVQNDDEVKNLIDSAVSHFGRLDIAVNNAGTEGTLGPVTEQTTENFESVFRTNVLGVLLSMKHELRVMMPQGSGSIVNISSLAGQKGFPNASVYVASKHAVQGLTKTAALEAAPSGVRVNIVAPGPIDTGMLDRFTGSEEAKAGFAATVPLQRIGEPDEVARAVVFVGSNQASFINGTTISVDGGMMA